MCILGAISFCFHQVKAVYFNNTPIPDTLVFLFESESWSGRTGPLLQNLTTDSNGIATFSLSTTNYDKDIKLTVSQRFWYFNSIARHDNGKIYWCKS